MSAAESWTVPSTGGEVKRDGDTLCVDLMYPPYPGQEPLGDRPNNPTYIEIDLMSVRANDGIRVHYDFERDGFVIEQPTWSDDATVTAGWREVHFCPAWLFHPKEPDGSLVRV